MPNRFSVEITPGMAFPLGAVCTARLADDPDDDMRHILDHFLYWCTHVDAEASAFTFTFTKVEDGAIGWEHARVMRNLLLESRKHANGRTRPAIMRRVAKIEEALNIDPVTRLGGRTAP